MKTETESVPSASSPFSAVSLGQLLNSNIVRSFQTNRMPPCTDDRKKSACGARGCANSSPVEPDEMRVCSSTARVLLRGSDATDIAWIWRTLVSKPTNFHLAARRRLAQQNLELAADGSAGEAQCSDDRIDAPAFTDPACDAGLRWREVRTRLATPCPSEFRLRPMCRSSAAYGLRRDVMGPTAKLRAPPLPKSLRREERHVQLRIDDAMKANASSKAVPQIPKGKRTSRDLACSLERCSCMMLARFRPCSRGRPLRLCFSKIGGSPRRKRQQQHSKPAIFDQLSRLEEVRPALGGPFPLSSFSR